MPIAASTMVTEAKVTPTMCEFGSHAGSSCSARRGLRRVIGPIELSAVSWRASNSFRRQVDALLDQAAGELRHVAGGVEVAAGDAAVIDARLLKAEQVLNRVVAVFQRSDFRDPHHAPNAALEAGQVHDQRDGRGDVPADDRHRQVEAGHADHHFQPREGVAGVVGVDRGQRAFVAGVHRLQHVEGFAAADFADDDPVGPHAQGVAHQVALRRLRRCLRRSWAAFPA